MSLHVKTDSLFSAELKVKIFMETLKNIGDNLRAETETIAGSWQCEYTDQFCETMEAFIKEMETAYENLVENLPAFLKSSAELYEQAEKDVAANAQQFKNVRTSFGKGTSETAFTSAEQATTFTASWEKAKHADSSVHTASSVQTHGGSGRTFAEESSGISVEGSTASSEGGSTSAKNNDTSEESGSTLTDWISQVTVSVGAIAKGILDRVMAEQTGTVTEGSGTEATSASGNSAVGQESITDTSSEVTAVRVVTEEQRAAMDSVSDQMYVEDGDCNMNAVANLVRRRQALDGQSVTATTLSIFRLNNGVSADDNALDHWKYPKSDYYSANWYSPLQEGIEKTYFYKAVCEEPSEWSADIQDRKVRLLSLLEEHPEGIVMYLQGNPSPHGIVITEYVEGEGFYVVDSGNSAGVISLDSSYTANPSKDVKLCGESFLNAMIKVFYLE